MTAVARTDVGRVRTHNEDAFLVLDRGAGERARDGQVVHPDPAAGAVLAVCDGLGGQAAGEVASALAADTLARELGGDALADATAPRVSAEMDRAVLACNERIYGTPPRGMATTVTLAVAAEGRLHVSQVGDSRAYLRRDGVLTRLTRDQSVVGQLIDEGMDPAEAEQLAARNIVLQAVGVEESLRVETRHWELRRGDLLMLCSDGLNGMLDDEGLLGILNAAGGDLTAMAEALIDAANDAGGRDNITVVLASFDGAGLPEPKAPLRAAADRLAGAPLTVPFAGGGGRSTSAASRRSAAALASAFVAAALLCGVLLAWSPWSGAGAEPGGGDPSTAAVVFLGVAGAALTLERQADGGWRAERTVFVGDDGTSPERRLEPGRYRLIWEGGEHAFDVTAGGERLTVRLR